MVRRRIGELTVNASVVPAIRTATNRAQFLKLSIPRAAAVASTSDGREFPRIADQSKPVTGDGVMCLSSERSAIPWETQTTLQLSRSDVDAGKRDKLIRALRDSDHVKISVKVTVRHFDRPARSKPLWGWMCGAKPGWK